MRRCPQRDLRGRRPGQCRVCFAMHVASVPASFKRPIGLRSGNPKPVNAADADGMLLLSHLRPLLPKPLAGIAASGRTGHQLCKTGASQSIAIRRDPWLFRGTNDSSDRLLATSNEVSALTSTRSPASWRSAQFHRMTGRAPWGLDEGVPWRPEVDETSPRNSVEQTRADYAREHRSVRGWIAAATATYCLHGIIVLLVAAIK